MATRKGKQPRLGPSDLEVALEEWDRQLINQEDLEKDFAMACSLDRAVRDDGATITLFQQEEARAHADRQLAMRIARMGGRTENTAPTPFGAEKIYHMNAGLPSPSYSASRKRAPSKSPEASGEAKPLKSSQEHEAKAPSKAHLEKRMKPEIPESSKMAKPPQGVPVSECACVSCNDIKESIDITKAPCLHNYCTVCLVQLVELAIRDESFFPPRCCRQTLPLSIISALIGPDLTRKYEEKSIELADPSRTYCSNQNCSAYILPDRVCGYIGTCGKCGKTTCTICKQASHKGKCRTAEDVVLDVATAQKWQRCRCGHVVELNTGCNHITDDSLVAAADMISAISAPKSGRPVNVQPGTRIASSIEPTKSQLADMLYQTSKPYSKRRRACVMAESAIIPTDGLP
ncbi:hypothetical protein PENSUB_5989 [Penicillium subrubescens]|uniref:IBR domain-containing protein n=1 Tax=Penicillium subrubescens TaxID=1316194 RepID=A0A1Q5U4L2_9EURO|nr:hypothetical protein PENSUB_5989 [Penicillium subrubescens]